MKRSNLGILICSLLMFSLPLWAADTYVVDPGHSHVGFSVTHLVIATVKGNFKEFSGTILLDESDMTKSSVSGKILAGSVNTENASRDKDLRSSNFFDVEKFPEILFQSKKIEKSNGQYLITGDLTMKGVTKEIQLKANIRGPIVGRGGKKKIGIEAHSSINRQDFGVSWNSVLEGGGVAVSNEVEIELHAEANQQ